MSTSGMVRVAIDPGNGGGCAWVLPNGDVEFRKCPTSREGFLLLFRPLMQYEKRIAYIEGVHAFPATVQHRKCQHCGRTNEIRVPQGSKSIWTFAQNDERWKMTLVGMGFDIQQMSPQSWMGRIGKFSRNKQERKRELRDFAQTMFPDIKCTLINGDALAILWAMTGATQVPKQGDLSF